MKKNDYYAIQINVIAPPLGLTPRDIYEEKKNKERFHEVCSAISRYYNAGKKIPVEWIIEYNELVTIVKHD